jgi:hypothetical protein
VVIAGQIGFAKTFNHTNCRCGLNHISKDDMLNPLLPKGIMMSVARFSTMICLTALLAACDQDEPPLPILTDDVFFKAAEKCRARDPIFTFRTQNRSPSISFVIPSSEVTSGETAQCIADAIVGYNFETMQIRVAQPS